MVRNKDGIWINTSVFTEAANHFKKHGVYCFDPEGSDAWYRHWMEELTRCVKGYSVGGAKIPGEYYFYLNYCPIKRVKDTSKKRSVKVESFPDFWDGDYNYFWVRYIARNGLTDFLSKQEQDDFELLDDLDQINKLKEILDSLHLDIKIPTHRVLRDKINNEQTSISHHLKGGYNLIVGKSRRKGYSYKNSSIAAYNYFTKPESVTILNAYQSSFLVKGGIMGMALKYISFINENTAWRMPSDVIHRSDRIKNSHIEYKNGTKIEKGFNSEIIALTCKDNPDANRGKDALDIMVEEAGKFGTPGLLKSLYKASEDCVLAGEIKTGLITIFGTSGDMEKGTVDYAEMFMDPESFDLLPFSNIWDADSENQNVGFFHPINLNMEGFYDKQGNSDKEGAKDAELKKRKKLINIGTSSEELQKRMWEKPLTPSEAFVSVSLNIFPISQLRNQLQKVRANNWQNIHGVEVEMIYEGNEIVAKPIKGAKRSITSLHNIPLDKRGCPVIYEYPVDKPPKGLYKIGYDPVRQDEGTSLAAIIVYKSVHVSTEYHDLIVAEYIGRLESAADIDRLASMFADLYNTTIMHENEVPAVRLFFERIKRLDLLARQPNLVINKSIRSSKVARVYGCHMTNSLKDAGERYVKDWLLTVVDHDEHGNKIFNLDKIYSQRLLEELISYNRKGNFDLISALFMCLFQVQEEDLGKEYDKEIKNKNAKKLLEMMNDMYTNSNDMIF